MASSVSSNYAEVFVDGGASANAAADSVIYSQVQVCLFVLVSLHLSLCLCLFVFVSLNLSLCLCLCLCLFVSFLVSL